MIRFLVLGILGLSAVAVAEARPPLYQDPVRLNIGYLCKWQVKCVERQQAAMRKALSYVDRHDPPIWRVQQCNRNASRTRSQVDWIGFYNCIRNSNLKSSHRSASR